MTTLDLSQLACATCTKELHRRAPIDPNSEEGACVDGHRFFYVKNPVLGQSSRAASLMDPPPTTDLVSVVDNWLTIRRLRLALNDRLAEVLLRIYEMRHLNMSVESTPFFRSCVYCKGKLSRFEQDDCWVEGLACGNGHRFLLRHGLFFPHNGQTIALYPRMTDEDAALTASAWLKVQGREAEQVHPQVRWALRQFLKQQ